MDDAERQLFQAVVAATGLSSIFAPGTVRRALADAGAAPATADVDDYQRALPALEARLRAFHHDPDLLGEALARVHRVLNDAKR